MGVGFVDCLVIAVIIFATALSMGKILARKDYVLDGNQELIAIVSHQFLFYAKSEISERLVGVWKYFWELLRMRTNGWFPLSFCNSRKCRWENATHVADILRLADCRASCYRTGVRASSQRRFHARNGENPRDFGFFSVFCRQ